MSAAIAQDPANMMQWRSVGARKSPARATQGTASCDGCRAQWVSPCAAVPDIGGAVVPPSRITERWFPAGSDIVEPGEAGHELCVITDGWAVRSALVEDGSRQVSATPSGTAPSASFACCARLVRKECRWRGSGVLRFLGRGYFAEAVGDDGRRSGRRQMSILRTVEREPARTRHP